MFTYIDINFDVKYEAHQNWPKILSMHTLRVFGHHDISHQNWHQYLWALLCQLIFFVNLFHSLCVWLLFCVWPNDDIQDFFIRHRSSTTRKMWHTCGTRVARFLSKIKETLILSLQAKALKGFLRLQRAQRDPRGKGSLGVRKRVSEGQGAAELCQGFLRPQGAREAQGQDRAWGSEGLRKRKGNKAPESDWGPKTA